MVGVSRISLSKFVNHNRMSQRTICLDTELRKLRPAELYTLGQILSISDSWKKLMAIVPKEGNPNLSKFNAEHFSMIEQAAQQQRRNAAEIFLVEWGTMDRKRPTLRILLNLLTKAELFRAADYVAGDILKEELPKRPECGPAAPVDISDDLIRRLLEENLELRDTNFKESLIFELPTGDNNQAMNPNAIKNEMNHSSVERNMQSTKLVSIKEDYDQRYLEDFKNVNIQQRHTEASSMEVSDLMKFSKEHRDECKTQDSPYSINIPNIKISRLHSRVFEKHEMLSNELPIFLKEFKTRNTQDTQQINVEQELTSGDLPACLNNQVNEVNNDSHYTDTTDLPKLSDTSIDKNELASFELPQCIVEFDATSTIGQDNIIVVKTEENVLQNVLNSEELPLTVLEYNE